MTETTVAESGASKKRGRKPKSEDGSAPKVKQGNSGYDPDKAQSYMTRIMSLLDEMESANGQFKSDIKEVYKEAADVLGIKTSHFKLIVGQRRKEMKIAAKLNKMESDEREKLDALEAALGDLCGTPLGEFAATLH